MITDNSLLKSFRFIHHRQCGILLRNLPEPLKGYLLDWGLIRLTRGVMTVDFDWNRDVGVEIVFHLPEKRYARYMHLNPAAAGSQRYSDGVQAIYDWLLRDMKS